MTSALALCNPQLAATLAHWKPGDFWRFCMQAAAGRAADELACNSDIDGELVGLLLEEPAIAMLIDSYRRCHMEEDASFREFLRPLVRHALERELSRPRPDTRLLIFLLYCLEFSGRDPVDEAISAILRHLRRKRRQRHIESAAAAEAAKSRCPSLAAGPPERLSAEENAAEGVYRQFVRCRSGVVGNLACRLGDIEGETFAMAAMAEGQVRVQAPAPEPETKNGTDTTPGNPQKPETTKKHVRELLGGSSANSLGLACCRFAAGKRENPPRGP